MEKKKEGGKEEKRNRVRDTLCDTRGFVTPKLIDRL